MLRILHLEDSFEDAFLIENAIREEGIQADVKVVRNRSEFEKALENSQFDLVLADCEISGFEGIEALRMIRKKYPGLGYICLSGLENPSNIKASFDAGATDYVSKNDMRRLMPILRREADRTGS